MDEAARVQMGLKWIAFGVLVYSLSRLVQFRAGRVTGCLLAGLGAMAGTSDSNHALQPLAWFAVAVLLTADGVALQSSPMVVGGALCAMLAPSFKSLPAVLCVGVFVGSCMVWAIRMRRTGALVVLSMMQGLVARLALARLLVAFFPGVVADLMSE
jgi:hypothetical protein